MLRILVVTNMYPTPTEPFSGVFVQRQVESLRAVGLVAEVLFINRRLEGPRAYLQLHHRVRASCDAFQPHLIHVMYGGVMANEVASVAGRLPVIVSFCGSDLLGDHVSGPVRKLLAVYSVWASYRAAGRAAGIVVKSENLRRALPAHTPSWKVRIIPNGVDLKHFKPLDLEYCRHRLGWNRMSFNVLFCAGLGDPVKRPTLARAAIGELNRCGLRTDLHEMKSVAPADVPLWLNAADCLLVTSQHEGSPNIVKECLSCDVPVVSVDVGDIAERISGIRGCYLADPHPEALAGKLALVYSGPRRVESRVHMQALSVECVARRMIEFYTDILRFSR